MLITDDFFQICTSVRNGGVICYPTEGVWGLGCHPQSLKAFQRLLTLKQRPIDKGVILLAADLEQLSPYVNITEEIIALFKQYHNDFVTFVLPKSKHCPKYLSGEFNSVAVRVSYYQPLNELCRQLGTALVSTSANISGKPTVKDIKSAQEMFGDGVDVYVDMPLGTYERPSKILKWNEGNLEVIRE